jgi:TrmH family RNA methyltransferase
MLSLALPKAKAKLLRKLEQRKYRQEFHLFVAEGYRLIEQYVHHQKEQIECIIQAENLLPEALFPEIDTYFIPDRQLVELAQTEHSQGVIAIIRMPEESTVESILQKSSLIIALDAIQDPGNLGTIVRNIHWFGADALILGTGTVDLFNPKTVRSSMSAAFHLRYHQTDLETFFTKAEEVGFSVYLLRLDAAASPLPEVSFAKKTILVIGNEGNGIKQELIAPQRTSVFIPDFSQGSVESLNAGVATAVALYACKSQSLKT